MPKLNVSAGFLYTVLGAKDANFGPAENPDIDAWSIATGVLYKATPVLNVNLGLLRTLYIEEKTSTNIKLNKDVFNIGLGVQYRF